jgi:hypothetical protein
MLGTVAVIILATFGFMPSEVRGAHGTIKVKFTATMSSVATTLNTLPGGRTYGWNHFAGTARWGGQELMVDFLGAVNYVNGSGPFEGFVTLSWANGTTLAFRIDGRALATETVYGTHTDFSGLVGIIGGTGELEGVTGIGAATGSRKGALGSPIAMSFTLTLTQADPNGPLDQSQPQ